MRRDSGSARFWELHASGMPVSAIALAEGVSEAEVRFAIREAWKRDESPAAR